MLNKLTAIDLSPYVGTKFRIGTESAEPLEVELIDVTELGSDSAVAEGGTRRRPFSVLFRGRRDTVLPQKIYRVEHDKVGVLDLFLVPIGPDGQGMRYEAVFT